MIQPVTVVAQILAKPGKEVQVREELTNLLLPTRAEDGCINYDLHESADNPALFLFYENWTSHEALTRHFETPHLKNLLNKADQLLARPIEISVWKRID